MEIQGLKLLVTDADLAVLIQKRVSREEGLEKIEAHILPEGIKVQGEYPTGFGIKVPFETLWQLTPQGPTVQVKLESIKVAGIPGTMFRGVLLRMIRDTAEEQPGIRVQDDTILLDLPTLVASQGIELRVNLTAVRMSAGTAVIESA